MGVWSSVLFGSGGAIQSQRWQGTLEMIMLAPRPPALVILPITLATARHRHVRHGRHPGLGPAALRHPARLRRTRSLFLVAVPGCILGLGMFGLLLASTFVLMRNANALTNTLEYPIWLVSGMLVPITVLPGWTGPIAAVLPTTWGARAVREAATGSGPVWPSLGICLAISLGLPGRSAR